MKKNGTTGSAGNIPTVIKRYPRPEGCTALAKESTKDNFDSYIFNLWMMNNGIISGIYYDTQALAKSLDISVEDIQIKMRDLVLNSKVWDKDNQEQILMGLMGNMLSWTLEDRMRVNSQINLLAKSQNGHYTPFVSAELNKAIKMGLDSSAQLQTVVQKFMGGGTTNILQIWQQNNTQNNTENYVTQEQALELIEESNKEIDKPQEAKILETTYDLKSLPEVVATKQTGVDTSKEGLGGTINIQKMNAITDNMAQAMKEADEDHHAMRREIEERIDPDADDPELTQYYEEISEEDNNESVKDFSAMDFLNKE